MFRQLLFPYGYKLHKSLFYKEINQEQCFLSLQKRTIRTLLYCIFGYASLLYGYRKEIEDVCDISDELGFDLPGLMKNLNHLCFIQNRKS